MVRTDFVSILISHKVQNIRTRLDKFESPIDTILVEFHSGRENKVRILFAIVPDTVNHVGLIVEFQEPCLLHQVNGRIGRVFL